MSSVGNLATARRPEQERRPEDMWSDLELPGWQEFIGARERFFQGLRRLERPAPRGRDDEQRQGAGEDPTPD